MYPVSSYRRLFYHREVCIDHSIWILLCGAGADAGGAAGCSSRCEDGLASELHPEASLDAKTASLCLSLGEGRALQMLALGAGVALMSVALGPGEAYVSVSLGPGALGPSGGPELDVSLVPLLILYRAVFHLASTRPLLAN